MDAALPFHHFTESFVCVFLVLSWDPGEEENEMAHTEQLVCSGNLEELEQPSPYVPKAHLLSGARLPTPGLVGDTMSSPHWAALCPRGCMPTWGRGMVLPRACQWMSRTSDFSRDVRILDSCVTSLN